MGQGDRKPKYTPPYEPVRDDVCGKMFRSDIVRSCPEPHVIKRYGVGGVANVSVWTCKRCKYRIEHKWYGGLGCELDKRVQT